MIASIDSQIMPDFPAVNVAFPITVAKQPNREPGSMTALGNG